MLVDDSNRWPLWKRIAFRFLSVYFVLYALPFPVDQLPFAGLRVEELWGAMWRVVLSREAGPFLGRPLVFVRSLPGLPEDPPQVPIV